MPLVSDSDSRNITRICKCQGCLNTFVVVLGSRGANKQHCSDACKQKAYRNNGGSTKYQKLHEIENSIALAYEVRADMLKEAMARTEEIEGLYNLLGLARAENWRDAEIMIETLTHAANHPSEYEGFHNG